MKYRLIAVSLPLILACNRGADDTVSPAAFTDGLVAIVENVDGAGWPRDGLTIESATVSNDTLRLNVRYGGGCRDHRLALLLSRAFMESHPVQVHARLAHDAGRDMCDAIVPRTLFFDLRTLKQHYRTSYGPGAATIVINLVGHGRSVRYSFD